MNNIEVIGLGALNIDHIYQVERILDDGEAVVEVAGSFSGGSAANTVYGLAKLGVRTGFVGAVGDDDEGRLMLEDFKKVGVNTSQIMIKQGVRTGSTLCLSTRSGKRSLYVVPSANNLLAKDDLDLAYINQTNLLHLSSFADDRQFQVLLELMAKLAPAIKVSFSPGALYSAKGLKALTPILEKTNVLFTNEEEIEELTDKDFIAGAKTCLRQGCQIIVVTLGQGKGRTSSKRFSAICYIRDASNEYLIEPDSRTKFSTVDTTGAGDAFATGFLYGLLKRKGLEECGQLGKIVALFCIGKVGARQGLPTLSELTERYRELHKERL